MMSFMGSIGSMMKGSGLEEALETVYGPNAVTHMITGKAVSKALRGHFLIQAALVNKLMSAVLLNCEKEHTEDMGNDDVSSSETLPLDTKSGTLPENKLDTEEVEQIQGLYEKI